MLNKKVGVMKKREVSKRKSVRIAPYTVVEAAVYEAIRRVSLADKIKMWIEENTTDPDMITAVGIYPHIAACTQPLMSIEEYFEIPETMLDQLTRAAMELNPHWFEVPDQEKKTDEPLSKSTDGSAT